MMNRLPHQSRCLNRRGRGGARNRCLQVNGLTKHFPVRGDLFSARKTVRAVDDVSFAIAKGENRRNRR